MSAPLVSVIVPSCNYARYLPEVLDCVLEQTFTDFELIVVDDGSADGSPDIARNYARQDDRVRVFTHPDGGNHGLAATLTLGLQQARGCWTAVLEADDVWLPQCLEARLEQAACTGADVVINDITLLVMPGMEARWFENYVPRVMRRHAAECGRNAGAWRPGPAFLMENLVPTLSCALIRTELLQGLSLDSPVSAWLDRWIWAQAALGAAFALVPEPLTRWRLHPESLHARIRFASYLRDHAAMSRALRRLWLGPLLNGRNGFDRRWAWAAFACLPACLQAVLRAALIARDAGPAELIRSVRSRLRPLTSKTVSPQPATRSAGHEYDAP